jgi:hypothetical protein
VTATRIGTASGRLTPVTGSALVCAGLVTMPLFPAGALPLLRRNPSSHEVQVKTEAASATDLRPAQ